MSWGSHTPHLKMKMGVGAEGMMSTASRATTDMTCSSIVRYMRANPAPLMKRSLLVAVSAVHMIGLDTALMTSYLQAVPVQLPACPYLPGTSVRC